MFTSPLSKPRKIAPLLFYAQSVLKRVSVCCALHFLPCYHRLGRVVYILPRSVWALFLRHLWPSDRKQFQSRFCSNQTAAAVPLCTRPRGRPSPTPPHPTPTPPLTWIRIVLERKSSVDKSNALWRKPCETLNNWRSTGGRRPTNDSHGHLMDRRSRNNGSESVARPRTAHVLSSVHQTAWVELSWDVWQGMVTWYGCFSGEFITKKM